MRSTTFFGIIPVFLLRHRPILPCLGVDLLEGNHRACQTKIEKKEICREFDLQPPIDFLYSRKFNPQKGSDRRGQTRRPPDLATETY